MDCQATDAFIEGLSSSSSQLESLCLPNNQITDVSLLRMSEGHMLCGNLHTLDLAYNCITAEGATAVAHALKSGVKLLHLNLEVRLWCSLPT